MLSNSTLKHVLAAALLFASASGFAQNNVELGDGTGTTWAEVVKSLNDKANNLDALTQAVTNAQKAFDRADATKETSTIPYLEDQQKAANLFLTAYNNYVNDPGTTVPGNASKIYYTKVKNKAGKYALTIGFTVGGGLTGVDEKTFFEKVIANEDEPVASLSIYLGQTEGTNNYAENNGCYQITSYTTAQQDNIVAIAVDALNNTLPTLKTFQVTDYNQEYKDAKEALEKAEEALTSFQTKYGTLTLTNNVTVANPIANFAGTIVGGKFTFTAPAGVDVFTKFTGELSNAAVNGSFASSISGAKFDNVALLNNGKGTFYNANGVAADYATVGALAFAARDLFGVSNKALVPVEDANKVYSITVYTSPTEAPTYYVTVDGGKYTNVNNGNEVPVGDNVFVKSATNDLTLKNVFYNDGTATTVEIKDRVDFYCPEDITATTVTYDRQFAEGHNAVCLPFAISSSNIDATLSVYSNTSDNKFWFNITEGTIAAHTPILMSVKTPGTLNNLNNVVIKKTESQIVAGKDGSYGLLKNANTQEILGAQHTDVIYALSGGEFKWGGDNTVFPAFRMVIASVEANPASSYSIAFLNGNGGSGLSGIDEVNNDSDALEVIGGNGEITINSSADCGNVAVYTIDGKVATNANVVAGTTTVNVAKGVYIVMGKKVLVK